MERISLGRLFGVQTTFSRLALISYLALGLLAAWLSYWLLKLPVSWALLAGLLSTLLFFVSEWLHQIGHASAARAVGYPMVGMHFFNVFSASQYPAEPPLPPATHVKRALGGFWVNTLIGLLLLPVALILWPRDGAVLPPILSLLAWLAGFGAFINLIVLGLGALLPLKIPGGGLNDGGTLLHYWLAGRREPK
jgi:Zn-dependent protease